MNTLGEIDGIGDKAIRLFAAVDIVSLDDLARQRTADLYKLLFEANREANIFAHLPPIHTVEEWVAAARILRGVKGGAKGGAHAGRNGAVSGVALAADEMTGVPPAEWMRLYEGALEARVVTKPEKPRGATAEDPSKKPAVQSTAAKLAKHGEIHATEGLLPSPGKEGPVLRLPKKEIGLAPAGTLESRFAGDQPAGPAEPLPARARRGLLHPQRATIYAGAFVAVVTRLLFFAVLIGTPLAAFVFKESLLYFGIVPALLLVFAILYAVYASRVRCRVCGAHLLVSRKCLKHENAHHVPGFGYVGSLSLHALLFAWFRCQYCGTPMRLRE